jgi:hypothetical protein
MDTAKEAHVRSEVKALLSRSPSFAALPAEAQEKLAADMEKVSGFLADREWLTAPRSTALEDKQPDAVDTLKMRLAQAPQQVGKGFTAGAIREATAAFDELVQKVDFSKFVGGLIHNVFQAIVDASIQQMQAYGELLAATAKTVDQFAADHISDGQARDYIANRYPASLEVDTSGTGPARLRPKQDGPEVDVGAAFGVEGADFSDEEAEQKVVDAAKLQMAQQRQQLLATMVLLGINRIVVTNGHINAKVVFDMRASDTAARRSKAQMSDEQKSQSGAMAGGGLFGGIGGIFAGFETSTSHETTVTSAVDDRSDSKAQLKAQLTGDVRVAFKSETFPLERMVDVLGMQNLAQKAQPPPSRPTSTPATAAPTPASGAPAAAAPAGGGR